MSTAFRRDFLQHFVAVRQWAARVGASIRLDPVTMVVVLVAQGQEKGLQPRFVTVSEGRFRFTSDPLAEAIGFCGWLPYARKRWDLSQSKITFKQWLLREGLRTPRFWLDANEVISVPHLIKRSTSSFGYGIRGPFPPQPSEGALVEVQEGEYVEEFVTGQIARGWFWNDRLAACEVIEMPSVIGDGRATIEELIRSRLNLQETLPVGPVEMAKLQGLSMETVLPVGTRIRIDFLYLSPLHPRTYEDSNRIDDPAFSSIVKQFKDAGRSFLQAIPYELRNGVAFAVDAIADDNGHLHFLEMNNGPQIHPRFYTTMLDSLFERDP